MIFSIPIDNGALHQCPDRFEIFHHICLAWQFILGDLGTDFELNPFWGDFGGADFIGDAFDVKSVSFLGLVAVPIVGDKLGQTE
jgi:hypothetical protein